MVIDNKDYSEQEALNQIVGVGNASSKLSAFGGSLKTIVPKGVVSNYDRTFKVTYPDGSRADLAFLKGIDRPHRIVGVSTANGSAISNTSKLIYPLY